MWELAKMTIGETVFLRRPRPPKATSKRQSKQAAKGAGHPWYMGRDAMHLHLSPIFFSFFLLSNFCVKQPGVVRRDQRPQPHPHRDRGEGGIGMEEEVIFFSFSFFPAAVSCGNLPNTLPLPKNDHKIRKKEKRKKGQ